ncbi:MAG: hypothetical protein J7M29_05280, partial [Verrucomicrobia bacterium]|nr:hypothetical protein [Verrucomicrobiota bacterium]
SDPRGLMYALLDAADRTGWAPDAEQPFSEARNVVEQPDAPDRALSIYTMHRRWFEQRLHDAEYWERYFDMMARNRFNRFVLIFGYENGGYMAPAYPWFLEVKGWPQVKVVGLTRAQQRRYAESLHRLIRQAHAHGIDFTAGLWDHIYRGGVQSGGMRGAKPGARIPGLVWGLNTTNLMDYSEAALAQFLEAFPEIDSLQWRMHWESGLRRGEETQRFWRRMFSVIRRTRPGLRVDLRAKGLPDEIIRMGLDMGIHLRIATKHWMEQMGLPFHPTHIPRQNQRDRRHGYADLLRYPREYQMHWRLWSGGTARILLWGSPGYARRFVASAHLYDGDGFEVNEPLAAKMASHPHEEKPFELLQAPHRYTRYEFERYWHFYQVWGRVGYNPNTPSEVWDREFARRFGPEAGPTVERALHKASWVLPRIVASAFPYRRFPTTRGWVEKQRWENLARYAAEAEGSDIQQFQGLSEAARLRLEGGESAKMSPETNSAWLLTRAREILKLAREAERTVGSHRNKEFESTLVDLKILAGLAEYHGLRIPAGVSYALYKKSGDVNALDDAIAREREAVKAWEKIVEAAGDFYAPDLKMGLPSAGLSGHWRDELKALRADLRKLEQEQRNFKPADNRRVRLAHAPVRRARPGRDLVIRATASGVYGSRSVWLVWRPIGGAWIRTALKPTGPHLFSATAPGRSIRTDIEYYLEAEGASGRATYPERGPEQPIRVKVSADRRPPTVVHQAVTRARPSKPLRITARARDPSGVKWVRLRYRSVNQMFDYATQMMQPTGRPDEYAAVVPGEALDPKWDFMYFIEAMDQAGNGKIYPDLERTQPYIIVRLHP